VPDSLFTYSVIVGTASNTEPVKYELSQNFPNPFNPTTNISFSIARTADVKILVYDVLGREVMTFINSRFNAGAHSFTFDGSELSSGIYYYTMYLDGSMFETKKMILMK
jgi:flagellar hook assembly protein FlgD